MGVLTPTNAGLLAAGDQVKTSTGATNVNMGG
jgi:hypothetical protein